MAYNDHDAPVSVTPSAGSGASHEPGGLHTQRRPGTSVAEANGLSAALESRVDCDHRRVGRSEQDRRTPAALSVAVRLRGPGLRGQSEPARSRRATPPIPTWRRCRKRRSSRSSRRPARTRSGRGRLRPARRAHGDRHGVRLRRNVRRRRRSRRSTRWSPAPGSPACASSVRTRRGWPTSAPAPSPASRRCSSRSSRPTARSASSARAA